MRTKIESGVDVELDWTWKAVVSLQWEPVAPEAIG
jgi:hypothetical protein